MFKSATDWPADWDELLARFGGHFLQSRIWGKFQESLGRPLSGDADYGWLWQAALHRSKGIKYLNSSYGPTAKSYGEAAIKSLIEAGREQGADFVRLEPVGQFDQAVLQKLGARSIAPLQPKQTWVLDLDKSEEELRAGLESGHRNRVNGAVKRGVQVHSSTDVAETEDFLAMMHDTAERSGIRNHSDEYFRKLIQTLVPAGYAKFYVATHEGKKISSALVYDFNQTRYYAHAGSFQALNRDVKASVVLVWQAIVEAQIDGKTLFDFWGVAPNDDPDHPWAGISQFKRAFGGRMVEYNGTWDIPLRAAKYQAYGFYRKLRGRQDG